LPSVTVARSALAHDALSDVAESDEEQPVSVSATAITAAAKIPKRFFTDNSSKSVDMDEG
jgi:hypothetical protein